MGAVSTMLLTKTSLIFFKHIPRLLYMFDFKWGGRLFKDLGRNRYFFFFFYQEGTHYCIWWFDDRDCICLWVSGMPSVEIQWGWGLIGTWTRWGGGSFPLNQTWRWAESETRHLKFHCDLRCCLTQVQHDAKCQQFYKVAKILLTFFGRFFHWFAREEPATVFIVWSIKLYRFGTV